MFKKIATGLATSALLLVSVMPAFADVTVDVSGNGARSNNLVKVKEKCSQKVTQKSSTTVGVSLNLSGNTGGNEAENNTGGSNSITTGNVSNTVTIFVQGGSNTAELPNCCCANEGGNTQDLTISNNGVDSTNTIRVKKEKKLKVKQKSRTNVTVTGTITGTTGNNETEGNTGGDNSLNAGHVTNDASVGVVGGSNNL